MESFRTYLIFSLRTTMGPRQSEPPPNADLTNDTDLAHNDHTIARDHNTRTAPSNHPDPHTPTSRLPPICHPLRPRRPSTTA